MLGRRPTIALLFALLAGCSSKTDPGGGTDTLTVLVEVVYNPSDRTVVEVDLRSASGNPIAGANVLLKDVDRGNEAAAQGATPGSYRASFGGYAKTIGVQISTEDNDALDGQLEGPSPHVLTRPPDGATVERAGFETLKVTWESDSAAEAVEIEAGDGAPVRLDGDPGEAELPLGPLLNGPQTLRVLRETTVDLAGGLPGSRMRARFETSVAFTLRD